MQLRRGRRETVQGDSSGSVGRDCRPLCDRVQRGGAVLPGVVLQFQPRPAARLEKGAIHLLYSVYDSGEVQCS